MTIPERSLNPGFSRHLALLPRYFFYTPLRSFLAMRIMLLLWHERARQRHLLMELDDRMLKDMGISRADAYHEARKPFWRP